MSQNDIASITRPYSYKYSVVIPAAGTGSRMKSYGPKSLIDIGNDRKVLDLQIENICAYMMNPQIVLVAGHEFSKVAHYVSERHRHVVLIKNEEYDSTNVGASIRLGLAKCKYNRVLIVNGDLIFNPKTLSVPIGRESMLLLDQNGTMKEEEVGCTSNNSYAEHLMYDLPNKWAQIAYFCGAELRLLHQICNNARVKNDFGFEIINKILDAGGKFKCVGCKESKVIDIDSSKDLSRIKDII